MSEAITINLTDSGEAITIKLNEAARGPAGTNATVDQTIIDGSTNAVSGNAVFDGLALKAPIASPTFTGIVTAPRITGRCDGLEVFCKAGLAINAGQVVYVTGASGNNIIIGLAQANAEPTSSNTIGISESTLATNGTGYAITEGLMTVSISAPTAVEGDPIWLSPTTAGGMVFGAANKPFAPNHIVYLGVVTRKTGNNVVEIYVKIQNGAELDELADVLISSPVAGQALMRGATLWENRSIVATDISDSTSAGRSLLTAADAAAQRTSLGLGTLATQSGTFSGTSSGTNTGDQFTSVTSQRLIGRHAGDSGAAQEVTVGNGLEFQGSGIRRSALTGDVTASAGSNSTTIANDAVTNAKLANVATATIKGRITAGTGDPEDLTPAQALEVIGAARNEDWVGYFTPRTIFTSSPVVGSSSVYVVGVPSSTPVWYDGYRFWVFYIDSGNLLCKYSSNGVDWTSSFTDAAGTGNIPSVNNSGRAFSICFGTINGVHYAFALINRSDVINNKAFDIWKWELTPTGLDFSINAAPVITNKPSGHNHLTPIYSYGIELNEILGVVQEFASPENSSTVAARKINISDLTTTGMGGGDWSNLGYAEINRAFKLSDGYLLFGNDQGSNGDGDMVNNGVAAEKTLITLGVNTFANESIVSGFSDQNYAANESHTGQSGSVATDDGVIWAAFIDDTDGTNGDFGKIHLLRRGTTIASTWAVVSTNLVGENARGLTLSSDGKDLIICYHVDNNGSPGNMIKAVRYLTAIETVTSPKTLVSAQSGHTIKRMAAGYRSNENKELALIWNEDNAGSLDVRIVLIR